MIIDLDRFVASGRLHWTALEKTLDWLEQAPDRRMTVEESERFYNLYQRASADLARLAVLPSQAEIRQYIEWLVARAYTEIHEARERKRFRPWRFVTEEFPRAFRRRVRAFQLAAALTLLGTGFGAMALAIDREAKAVLMPFEGLQQTPAERVAQEKREMGRNLSGVKTRFSAALMTHNTQVALMTLAFGMTFGVGTVIELFYNGVILGAVGFDYVHGGQGIFLLGWLLPHGVMEIPAILIAGQAGFVIAHALIGWGSRTSRAERLRSALPDIVSLAGGAALMLVWAAIVESFLSQYHEPVVPYGVKIAFGVVEAALLTLYLSRAGMEQDRAAL